MKCPKCESELKQEIVGQLENISIVFNELMYTPVMKYYCDNTLPNKEICKFAIMEFERA